MIDQDHDGDRGDDLADRGDAKAGLRRRCQTPLPIDQAEGLGSEDALRIDEGHRNRRGTVRGDQGVLDGLAPREDRGRVTWRSGARCVAIATASEQVGGGQAQAAQTGEAQDLPSGERAKDIFIRGRGRGHGPGGD